MYDATLVYIINTVIFCARVYFAKSVDVCLCNGCPAHSAAGPVLGGENVSLHDVTKPRPPTPNRGGDTGDESSESECEFAERGEEVGVAGGGEGSEKAGGGRAKKSSKHLRHKFAKSVSLLS